MKRLVNGAEVELSTEAEVVRDGNRLWVRTTNGVFSAVAVRQGDQVLVSYQGRQWTVERPRPDRRAVDGDHDGDLVAPMPGSVVEVAVAVGQSVAEGDRLVVVEAMKTHQSLFTPFDGTVESIGVSVGDQVREGQLLVRVAKT
jgi:acetyl/propionyl-CoA carboxylase alpha subunit